MAEGPRGSKAVIFHNCKAESAPLGSTVGSGLFGSSDFSDMRDPAARPRTMSALGKVESGCEWPGRVGCRSLSNYAFIRIREVTRGLTTTGMYIFIAVLWTGQSCLTRRNWNTIGGDPVKNAPWLLRLML